MNELHPPLTPPSVLVNGGIQGATAKSAAAPFLIIQKGGISMTKLEYQEYIRHTNNVFGRSVIRHTAIDIVFQLRRQWQREISLDYLNDIVKIS